MMLNFRRSRLGVGVCVLSFISNDLFFLNFCLVDEEIFSRKRCQRAAGSNKEKREEEEEEEAKKGEREIKARRETRERALFSTKLLERERVREFVRRRAHTRNAAKFR